MASQSQQPVPISCNVKAPLPVLLGETKSDFHSGCCTMEVNFPSQFYVEIGEIHFKNFYTAWLSLQVKLKEQQTQNSGESKWKTCVKYVPMMPQPHTDAGCEDYFTLGQKHFQFDLRSVIRLRFVLRQPSPQWKDFKIEDIKIFKTSIQTQIQSTPETPIPVWLTESKSKDEKHKEIKGVGSMDDLSQRLQQLWALVELTRTNQTNMSLGRYDVDGSYEINLLSYT